MPVHVPPSLMLTLGTIVGLESGTDKNVVIITCSVSVHNTLNITNLLMNMLAMVMIVGTFKLAMQSANLVMAKATKRSFGCSDSSHDCCLVE